MAARSVMPSRPADGDSDNEEISVLEQNRKISTAVKPEYGDRGGYRAGTDSPPEATQATKPHGLSNELSAPYEIPKFPIEQIETKLLQMKDGKDSGKEPDLGNVADIEDEFFVPHFQRISATGEDITGVPIEDLKSASEMLVKALAIRQKYMKFSKQDFPSFCDKFLSAADGKPRPKEDKAKDFAKATIEGKTEAHPIHPPKMTGDPWQCEFQPDCGYKLKLEKGVYSVYKNEEDLAANKPINYDVIDLETFVTDMQMICAMISDGPLKSFCFQRLSYLQSKYKLHNLLNEIRELAEQKAVSHRDFYNVRKVDTHIHAAACMNQKHLLRFIKKSLKNDGDVGVCKVGNKVMTLKEVFESMNLTPYDLTIDMLDCHADRNTFHRFDKFNAKYNPIGESRLREIYMKTDNMVNGKYFANILKEVFVELDDAKYTNVELRLSIYGRSLNEWDNLASWAVSNNVYSDHNRWLIQVPRLYDIYKVHNSVDNFQDIIKCLFQPLFEATIDPSSHPDLHRFLQYVSGFDSVDDESKPENAMFDIDVPTPDEWSWHENPPYSYYLYYTYVNITVLNQLRAERGLNTFNFRPHCGEAGPIQHLVSSFMMCESIAHGLLLRKAPVIQYLYYLCQMGIAMSPLSNNSLFLDYNRSPLPDYLMRGLNISISTDDPLQFHFTKEPLMEEYSIAAQVWKLSSCDMCELARNSVTQGGFANEVKNYWLGPNYRREGVAGNDITRTNVPDIRVSYRYETLIEELSNIFKCVIADKI